MSYDTVILLKEANWTADEIPKLLTSLDEDLLPDVDLQHGTPRYTLVIGGVHVNYEASLHHPPQADQP